MSVTQRSRWAIVREGGSRGSANLSRSYTLDRFPDGISVRYVLQGLDLKPSEAELLDRLLSKTYSDFLSSCSKVVQDGDSTLWKSTTSSARSQASSSSEESDDPL